MQTTNSAIQDDTTRDQRRSIFRAFDNLSLRTKLLLGLLLIFLIPTLIGVYSIQEQSKSAELAAATEAHHIAEIIALEASQDDAGLQTFILTLHNNLQQDAEVVNLDKLILADHAPADIGTVFTDDKNGEVAATLKDGQTRTFLETSTTPPGVNQATVVAMKDDTGKVVGAVIVDYTTLYTELQQATNNTIRTLIVFNVLGLLLALVIGQFVTDSIANPIIQLRDIAVQLGLGRLTTPMLVRKSSDEVGTLATTISKMASQLQGLIDGLEQRVSDRTQALERRSTQIQTAAEIGNAAASIHDLNTLLNQTAQLISLRFGFYHTGIFLLDAKEEYAVLYAANSEGGQRMLARGHKLQVGHTSIVGKVSQSGQPRIALDVGQDAVFFDNPDLPDTRSEMALPIVVSSKTIGVLDVQSTNEAAFTQEDATILRIVADLLAAAIENTRLLAESQAAVETARRAYGEIAIQAWKDRFKTHSSQGYRSSGSGNTIQIDSGTDWSQDASRSALEGKVIASTEGTTLNVPILVRGQTIGVIKLEKPNQAQWTELETQAAQSLADQLSGALDSARLYEESQKQATKEKIISDATAKVGSAINIENILQVTVDELNRALGSSEIILQLAPNKAD